MAMQTPQAPLDPPDDRQQYPALSCAICGRPIYSGAGYVLFADVPICGSLACYAKCLQDNVCGKDLSAYAKDPENGFAEWSARHGDDLMEFARSDWLHFVVWYQEHITNGMEAIA